MAASDGVSALWTSDELPGIRPDNNADERARRNRVIPRETRFATQSERGHRWIEQICSIRDLHAATPLGGRLPHGRSDRGGPPSAEHRPIRFGWRRSLSTVAAGGRIRRAAALAL